MVTTYGYDKGMMNSVSYSNETNGIITPNLAYLYDDFGRIDQVYRGSDLSTLDPAELHADYDYDPASFVLTTEKLNQDAAQPQTLTRYYDGLLRPLSVSAAATATPGSSFHTYAYQYDSAGRLASVQHEPTLDANGNPLGGRLYSYQYQDQSGSLIDKVTGPHHIVDNTWESHRNILLSKRNHNLADSETFSEYSYGVNAIGQRTNVSQSGTAFSINGSTSLTHNLAWSYDVRGQVIAENHSANTRDNAYRYDAIGNRTHDVHGGLALPATANYTANSVNEYTAVPTATAPTYDHDGNTLSGPVPGPGSSLGGASVNATDWLWDGENRLRSVKVNNVTRTYDYDYLGRRIAQDDAIYLYDGWNVLTLQGANSSSPACTYTWGLDLSGSLQGAGGVGGLLVTDHVGTECSALYDGNGNATQYRASGGYRARWEYDAFGRTTWQSSDVWSSAIRHRFSTKYKDVESAGLYYYGYRYYDPVTGRWPSRDPIEEEGGYNLYGFVENNGLANIDVLGLAPLWVCECKPIGHCVCCSDERTCSSDPDGVGGIGTDPDRGVALQDAVVDAVIAAEEYCGETDCPAGDDSCRYRGDAPSEANGMCDCYDVSQGRPKVPPFVRQPPNNWPPPNLS